MGDVLDLVLAVAREGLGEGRGGGAAAKDHVRLVSEG